MSGKVTQEDKSRIQSTQPQGSDFAARAQSAADKHANAIAGGQQQGGQGGQQQQGGQGGQDGQGGQQK
ncbi:hypothetical protein CTA2_4797 [Colletotrichum tanaceti]|uniref:SMP domain-containing protein n=1 Tax=Colletotrichum tanaceti TaxID=1306861 RepID=A0A4U6XEJ4_9PEZI|nr:hypothetical protein CTA2_4797 [Colletotrichum tanaceti]TKW53904.1 hypothetical protein CTA1_8164 [Colletotrichum tanaceti]